VISSLRARAVTHWLYARVVHYTLLTIYISYG